MSYELVEAARGDVPTVVACEALGVSKSAYYEGRKRSAAGPSEREREELRLEHAIRTAFEEFRGVYGRPRLQRVLRARGHRISVNRLKRKMAEMGLQAKPRRKFKKTTDSEHDGAIAPNLLQQTFSADAPNRVWCSDLTYVRTWEGWLYVCVIVDLFSRKVVGWAVADHMRADLVTDAFDMAVGRRAIEPGLIFHSDRGSQYASKAMRRRLRRHKMRQSMSGKGNCYDNAVVESFNDKLKQELVHRHVWPTKSGAKTAIAEYIERFYNAKRMHSALGYVTPNAFEDQRGVQEAA